VAIFHGWGGNEDEFLGNRKVRSEADKRVYILVAPRGLGSSENNYNSWSFSGSTSGGMFTWELGQNAVSAPTFRAIAPVIGLPHRGYLGGPANDKPMPALRRRLHQCRRYLHTLYACAQIGVSKWHRT
jgi:hypothetical protein